MATIKYATGLDLAVSPYKWQGYTVDEFAVARGQGAGSAHYDDADRYWLSTTNAGSAYTSHLSSGLQQAWIRWYFFVEEYPDATSGDGMRCIWQVALSSGSSGPAGWLVIDDQGYIKLYDNLQTSNTLLVTSSRRLATGQWYRMEVTFRVNTLTSQPAPNPPYQTNCYLELRVNGETVLTYDPNGADITSTGGLSRYSGSPTISAFSVGFGDDEAASTDVGTSTNLWAGCIDDIATSEDGWIGPGALRTITPTGLDTAGWGLSATNIEDYCGDAVLHSSSASLSSTTSQDEFIMTCPTLRDMGIVSTTRYVSLLALTTAANGLNDCQPFVEVNGVRTYGTTIGASANTFWSDSKVAVDIEPDDVIKIGIRKDATATSRTWRRLVLEVEARSTQLPSVTNRVRLVTGSYTGNGTAQEVSVGFKPDWVMIAPIASGVNIGLHVFSRDVNGYPDSAWTMGRGTGTNQGIKRFTDDGFIVYGGAASLNASGTTFGVIAVADPYHRVFARAMWRMYGINAGREEPVIWYRNPNFVAEFLLTQSCQNSSTVLNCVTVGPGHAAGYATCQDIINEGLNVTNQINSIYAGGFTFGEDAYYGSSGESFRACFGVRTTHFYDDTKSCVYVGTYTGTGSGSIDVNLPADLAAKVPVAAWVFRASGGGAGTYDYVRLPGFSNSDALRAYGTGIDSNIMSFSTGKVTVQGALNTSAMVYNIVVFVENDDTLPRTVGDPDPTGDPGDDPDMGDDPWTGDPPTTWDLDWPDDLPGLLGIKFRRNQYNSAPIPVDPRTYKVMCEQRTFPVPAEQTEFEVACEQKTFDALAEYP